MPFTLSEATGHIGSWLNRKVTRILYEGPEHVAQVVRLHEDAGSTGGNLVIEAQVAASAKARKATV